MAFTARDQDKGRGDVIKTCDGTEKGGKADAGSVRQAVRSLSLRWQRALVGCYRPPDPS